MSLSSDIAAIVNGVWRPVFEPQSATLRKLTGSTGSEVDGSLTPTYSLTTVYPIVEEFAEDEVDGREVLRGDRKAWFNTAELETAGLEPAIDDEIQFSDGSTMGVVRLLPVKPMGEAILYGVQVRG